MNEKILTTNKKLLKLIFVSSKNMKTEKNNEVVEVVATPEKKKRARVTLSHICEKNGAVFVRIPESKFTDMLRHNLLNSSDYQEQLDELVFSALVLAHPDLVFTETARSNITKRFSADKFDATKMTTEQKEKLLAEAKKLIEKLSA